MLSRLAQGLTVVVILAFVGVVYIGKRGMGPHVFRARVVTQATPVSLFGALMDPEAIRDMAGEMPGYGRLVRIEWSRPPGKRARVTERYEKGEQTYWIGEWDPPRAIEERYEIEEDSALDTLTQRWTTATATVGTIFEVEQTLVPSDLAAAFMVEMQTNPPFSSGERKAIEAKLQEELTVLATWALNHPVTSTTAAVAGVTLERQGGSPTARRPAADAEAR